MNMAKYGSRRSQQPKNISAMLNQLEENLKVIFFTETKCKIRFIYVGFNCKRQKWGKKCLEIMTIKGGGGGSDA